ncbi:hypothetical protein QTP81_12030 [Alteromonas sp. ASW11-36]|uniref:Uncharacterized protein n=1 Tax=Alteromonas arenosi TaxID=3055817 RepID=A0ABT7SYQ3_9ALTE|nr:hypothetical protein [Alteromonas sp. ASW11-36]MDM7861325.1 hypothetical protein [Alteromonas sp. ASW11-36]
MPNPIHYQKHLKLLLFSYTFFTLAGGSVCLLLYFFITGQTPSLWLAITVFNALWFIALVSGLKASYLTGLADQPKTLQLPNKPRQ